MTDDDIARAYELSAKKVAEVSLREKRYLYSLVDWDDRLISLRGPRGTGKTTMFLQKIRESGKERSKTLYVSLDSIWLNVRELYGLADYHCKRGGTRLVVDEVHYLEDWQKLMKNLNDDFPDLKVAYTGSSMLKLKSGQGDLSRRQTEYDLTGLSFREYLKFEGVLDVNPIPLETILADHVEIAMEISHKTKVIAQFENYIRHGYYPFYLESVERYPQRLRQVVNQSLDSDWPSVEDVTAATIRKARRLLRILAEMPPQTPKMGDLYDDIDTERRQGLKVLAALERAGLARLLPSSVESVKNLAAPEKIYCDNTNIMHALVASADSGTERETFFMNQVSFCHSVGYPKKGDFLVDGKYLFEVGGAKKGFGQIADLPNSYVVNDDIEVGHGNKIPLWLFGFLY